MVVEDYFIAALERDVQYGYLDAAADSPRYGHPQVVLNNDAGSMLRVVREELRHCDAFSFSVAFVSPRAIALLKQELVEFRGRGQIVTSDYLGFNRPEAFAELAALQQLGIDTRIHQETAYHPKGYVFEHSDHVTAILGSSNLTENALVRNHEWNLKVTAATQSDLARQFTALRTDQHQHSVSITPEWIAAYKERYVARPPRTPSTTPVPRAEAAVPAEPYSSTRPRIVIEAESSAHPRVVPNSMQQEALRALAELRYQGKKRGLVISATGTGKTILSALDVRAVNPGRTLFVVHREQVLDRAIAEYKKVLGGPGHHFGKLTGGSKNTTAKYLFATVQTLSKPATLQEFSPDDFDYILVDEVHRAGAKSYEAVLEHFHPRFLLGMTATPERSDDKSVFELFDYNVPYEIRLGRALEADMLAPFHYYGVTDVTFDDGEKTSSETEIARLGSAVRAAHVVQALETYGQAGVDPRGLIFCSRRDEAERLAAQMNQMSVRGRRLRTVALTGSDSVETREAAVRRLERGDLDYILTVDVFNEGVDIPTINQVVMLRQTQSAIVFVQQLGRGLRKAQGKEYLVVVDFIGNYANNYLIPVALFGDESLNKESLRKEMQHAEEAGVTAGLSSVRFDKIAEQRVLNSISTTTLDSMHMLKQAMETMRNRLGAVPRLYDFLRFESVDPVILATKAGNYPALVNKALKVNAGFSERQMQTLCLLSAEVLAAKRPHEALVLQALRDNEGLSVEQLRQVLSQADVPATQEHVTSVLGVFTTQFHTEQERKRYGHAIVEVNASNVSLTDTFRRDLESSETFAREVDDIIKTTLALVERRYDTARPFTPGRQYSRKDACRLLNWASNSSSTVYGYRSDIGSGTCPIFVTYHKGAEVSASTAYGDKLLDRSTLQWFTRSRRTLKSKEVAAIVDGTVRPFVFAKKDDADGSDFYFLGEATPSDPVETTMPDDHGKELDVVRMKLRFAEPIDPGVYDYFHPTVMA